jgi:large subunit ribosomal protein L13|uniref:Large ribosomal subunit protein uL13c n=1 Tax=Acanthoceras zachariasii TaxID=451788 RepID=A0A2U9NTX2_9STRA|nr:ribosomal protein L13 [Acanthoceras zachariasii]AWT40499.1 ribosomal protein L13 [Acanthoceras zachariasii]
MNETFIPASNYNKRKWYIIDCKGKQLGRISSSIVGLLCGKIKPSYHPAFDTGDYVILVNADDLSLDRKTERFYVFNPGRPGKSLKKLINGLPQRIIENCIYKMMPNGVAKKDLAQRLKIYKGSQHPHQAQNPIYIDNIESFTITQ